MKFISYDYAGPARAVLDALRGSSQFQMSHGGLLRAPYPGERYGFRQHVVDALLEWGLLRQPVPLEDLHRHIAPEHQRLDFSLQNTVAIKFYETPPAILETYRKFIAEFVSRQVLNEDVVFQAVPTFRFYFSGAEGQAGPPLIHNDVMFGHPPQVINLWIPLSRCSGANSLLYSDLNASLAALRAADWRFDRFENMPGGVPVVDRLRDQLHFFDGDFGDCLLFDARCLHGTPLNTTAQTRVSIDARVMLRRDYEALDYDYVGVGRRKTQFKRGYFFDPRFASEI